MTASVRRTSLYEHLSSPVPDLGGNDATVITEARETHDDQGHDLAVDFGGEHSVITRSDGESADEESPVLGLGYLMPSASTYVTKTHTETYDDDPGISRLGDPQGM